MKRLAAIFFMLFLFTGCNISNPEEYMRTPKAAGIYNGLQEALEDSAGNDILLKFPRSGDSLSAFVPICVEQGLETVVAIYKPSGDASVTHFNLLKRINKRWVSVDDFEGLNPEVESVKAADFGGGPVSYIVATWPSLSDSNLNLVVLSVENNKFIVSYETNCTKFAVGDFDGDNVSELLTVSLDTVNRKSVAALHKITKNSVTKLGEVNLDGTVASYSDIKVGKLNDGTAAAFIDGFKGSETINSPQTMITDLVFYNKSLNAPFNNGKDNVNITTYRQNGFSSLDIDKDNRIEIPLSTVINLDDVKKLLKNPNVKTFWQNPNLTFWYEYGQKMELDFAAIMNYSDGYYLKVEDGLFDNNYRIGNQEDEKLFKLYFGESSKNENEAMHIKVIELKEWTLFEKKGYVKLAEKENRVYAVWINPSFHNKITAEKVKEIFNLMQ